ncbi:MAG: ribonuclease H-like domain-containing protein [Thermodesulfobacteria bacterium]|nr:ribonuclease H-like domain-containing protein [Thermodesulfobacteriota bacterium]
MECPKYQWLKFSFNEKETWKVYLEFPEKCLFVDIETEGLSKEKNDITLIGIYKNGVYNAYIKGINLESAVDVLEATPVWITFGGENFDLPFIKKKFPFLNTPIIHLDLFFLTRRIGLKGGLKKIEKAIGIARETDGMNGYHAVKLWQRWEKEKDRSALDTLITYNKEDVINLKLVLEYVIKKLLNKEG